MSQQWHTLKLSIPLAVLLLLLTVACGGADTPAATMPTTPATQSTASPLLTASPSPTAESSSAPIATPDHTPGAAAMLRSSQGLLRVAENQFPTSLDADVGFAGYSLMSYGIAEALMRVTPQMTLEPWVAAGFEQVDALTWRVTIRDDVTFWDGSKVDANAVKTSLERSRDKQPGTAAIFPPETVLTANGQTLTLETPVPVALLPNSLASFNFAIKKESTGDEPVYTGPFIGSEWIERTSITLQAYENYRGGPPRLATIDIRRIPDVTTRVLALQSGDVDIAHALLPSDVAPLRQAGFQVHTFPFGRQNDIILNVARTPLDEVEVRRAIALAVDRDALLQGVMDGVGTPASGLGPENLGLPGIVATQSYDQTQAQTLLDGAGWSEGADGIRVKDGQRLAFSLVHYPSRAELEPLAIAVQDQLQEVGIEVSLISYPDINTTVATNDFDATFYSYGVAPFGDFSRAIASLYTPSGTNQDRYSNPQVNELARQYNQTPDPEGRLDIFRRLQVLVGEDVPVVYIINPYQITATNNQVKNFTPHPLENYKIGPELAIE